MRVAYFDHSGSDRHVAAYFWTSTEKDEDAFTCEEEDVERILRFGMRADPPHATPFGHPHLTVKVEEIPLPIAEQWIRHRVQNFSKKSYRYVRGDGAAYIPPVDDMRRQVGRPGHYVYDPLDPEMAVRAQEVMARVYAVCAEAYDELVEDVGLAQELARFVLPTGTATRMYATASLRNWLNFLHLRADEHAQVEIRRCAEQVEAILDEHYPITMRLWRKYGRKAL